MVVEVEHGGSNRSKGLKQVNDTQHGCEALHRLHDVSAGTPGRRGGGDPHSDVNTITEAEKHQLQFVFKFTPD